MPNASSYFIDRSIRHSIWLQRLSTQEVRNIIGFLNTEVYPDIISQIDRELARIQSRGFTVSTSRFKRLQSMMQSIRGTIETGYRDAFGRMRISMGNIALTEAEWTRAVMADIVPLGIDFVTPSPALLKSIIDKRTYLGKFSKTWFDEMGSSLSSKVQAQINIGLTQGESISQMTQRIRGTRAFGYNNGILQQSRRQVETNVRTAVRHTTVHAREMTFEENADIVKEVQWVSTLDARTTDICMSLDGEIFKLREGPRPPMHHQCRSDVIPVFKGFEELGLKNPPPATRAALDGEYPATVTYGPWLKGQPAVLQDQILGPTRAKLFRKGLVPIDRFVDDKFRRLTLQELIAREGLDPKVVFRN